MPKPRSKESLLLQSQLNYKELIDLVESFSKEELKNVFKEETMNRNIRDVLAHLHAWHLMMFNWYEKGMKGEKPIMPAEGYTWKTLPDLNKKIWISYQNVELEIIKNNLAASYENMQTLIMNHTDEELFQKKRYKWTGSTSLGAYFISNTSSHYAWAIRIIKKSMK